MPHLRPLRIGDAEKLIPLFKVLTGNEMLIDESSLIDNANCICLVYAENDELFGFGSLVIHQVPTRGEVGRIEDLVISENHQGKGFGKILVLKLIEIAKERKIKKITLTSNPMRINARKLYDSIGFTKGNMDTFLLNI
jgi:phosphinothricin acetyltransferase